VYVIIGLGNPGKEYEFTRHSVGFMVLDVLKQRYGFAFKKAKGPYSIALNSIEKNRTVFIKPLTYMNESGRAVRAMLEYYKIEDLSKMLVISDDINLPFGTVRLRPSGSDGGQKGLRSIIDVLGSQEFPRLRVGIGNGFSDAAQYVLSPFKKGESKDLPDILDWAADAVEFFIRNGIDSAMSKFNRNLLEES
jgi:PTH1 family peptidyl-tRNA hydrolase